MNEKIRDKELRVVDADGSQLGILSLSDAMQRAASQNLDLVKIAPQASPPVCRIMDYGKYRYEQQRRDKEARKNQKIVELKEVRMSLNIGDHDFETKAAAAKKFLAAGNKVKVSVRFRGRELAHTHMGRPLLERFGEACSEFGVVERIPKMEGRSMILFIASKTKNR